MESEVLARFAEATENWETWRIPVFWDKTLRRGSFVSRHFQANLCLPSTDEMSQNNEHSPWILRHLNRKTKRYLETSGSEYPLAQCDIPKEGNPQVYRCENLSICRTLLRAIEYTRVLWSTGQRSGCQHVCSNMKSHRLHAEEPHSKNKRSAKQRLTQNTWAEGPVRCSLTLASPTPNYTRTAFLCIRSNVELKSTGYFAAFCVAFP